MTPLLLDTCAVIFIAEGTPMTSQAQGQIRAASIAGLILVSPISAWEVGLLSAKNRFPFRPDPKTWFHRFDFLIGIAAVLAIGWWIWRHIKHLRTERANA